MPSISRRSLIRALAALPTLPTIASAHAQTTPTTAATGVATTRGDAGQTGRMPGPGPVGAPGLLWHAPELAGAGFAPVADGDLVFAMAYPPAPLTLVAVDAASGSERWRLDRGLGGGAMQPAAPTVADGVVYVSAREGD